MGSLRCALILAAGLNLPVQVEQRRDGAAACPCSPHPSVRTSPHMCMLFTSIGYVAATRLAAPCRT